MQPYFAQYLGILWVRYSEQTCKRLEFQKKTAQLITEALPKELRYWSLNFAPEFDYDLPLLWQGWTHTLLLTYWVDIRQGYEVFLKDCASHVRREIKKADQAGLTVRAENAPEKVIELLKLAKPVVARTIPARYFDGLAKNARAFFEQGKSVCLVGYAGDQAVAGIIYFFHGRKMIYYQGSTHPDFKNSGIMSKIIAESVRLYGSQYDYLDFDGSMLEPIERFFRGFGGFPVRYSRFTLNRLPWVGRVWMAFRGK